MADETALVPIEEKTVDFYGDAITAALVEVESKEEVYVPLRPICDYLGLDWSAQFRRVKRDEVLTDSLLSVAIMATETGQGRGKRDTLCLPLKFLPGWLFGVTVNKVRPELQEKIIRYRRECYDVLWRAFQSEVLETVDTRSNPNIAALVQIKEMGKAITAMAEQQIEMEQRLTNRLDRAAQVVGQMQKDITALKHIVQPGATISEAQSSVISSTVKALAEYLSAKEPGKNHYQGIFSELYRRFRVSDYHNIKQADYQAVLSFLDDWQRSGGGKGITVQGLMNLDEPETD